MRVDSGCLVMGQAWLFFVERFINPFFLAPSREGNAPKEGVLVTMVYLWQAGPRGVFGLVPAAVGSWITSQTISTSHCEWTCCLSQFQQVHPGPQSDGGLVPAELACVIIEILS